MDEEHDAKDGDEEDVGDEDEGGGEGGDSGPVEQAVGGLGHQVEAPRHHGQQGKGGAQASDFTGVWRC